MLAEVREVITTYFTVHGNNTSASLTMARDLAEAVRQVLDRVPLEGQPAPEEPTVITFADAQVRAGENKIRQGFNTTNVPLEFCLLQGEIAEAFDAWRKGRADAGEELADVAIYLLGLAEMTGVDLEAEVERKLAVNEAREYVRLANGTPVKAGKEPS